MHRQIGRDLLFFDVSGDRFLQMDSFYCTSSAHQSQYEQSMHATEVAVPPLPSKGESNLVALLKVAWQQEEPTQYVKYSDKHCFPRGISSHGKSRGPIKFESAPSLKRRVRDCQKSTAAYARGRGAVMTKKTESVWTSE